MEARLYLFPGSASNSLGHPSTYGPGMLASYSSLPPSLDLARIDQALKSLTHVSIPSADRFQFTTQMFYGALLYVFVLMQSQNPLFTVYGAVVRWVQI